MKKIMSTMQVLCFCVLLHTLTACEEEITPIPQTFFSFTYNGKQYNFGEHEIDPYGSVINEEQQWLVGPNGSIWINRQDIFGGVISYGDSNCTFLSPVHNNLLNLLGCQLTTDGAVDSTAVYFYKSGTRTFTLDNCITRTGYDFFFTGLKYTETICVQNGTFDLELINKQNKIIHITNGKYRFNIIKN